MKFYATVIKSLKENLRDWKVLSLVLVFSPFFVLLMYLFYGGEPTVYKLGIMNMDRGKAAAEIVRKLELAENQEHKPQFQLLAFEDLEQLKTSVKEKKIDLAMILPSNFSESVERGNLSTPQSGTDGAEIDFYGSMANLHYTMAAILSSDIIYKQGMSAAKINLPFSLNETFLEKKAPVNEFESYVPGLISLAVLMILFTASATIVKENDQNTLIRLKLSRLNAFDFLAGVSVVQAAVATIALVLSYVSALALGYRPEGSFWSVLLVGVLSSFSMVAISLIVASFLDTIFDVLTIGCFPFFILMFFSGGMFPIPKIGGLTLGGHVFGINDILPLTHTADAFNKILNQGATVADVSFEITMIILLTGIYFFIGLALYQRRKLSRIG